MVDFRQADFITQNLVGSRVGPDVEIAEVSMRDIVDLAAFGVGVLVLKDLSELLYMAGGWECGP